MNRLFLIAALGLACTVSCVGRYGMIGAIFRLSEDSPLPSWVALPEGSNRDQISVKIIHYEPKTTRQWKVRFIVRRKNGRVFQEKIGTACWHPETARKPKPAGTFPNWVVIDVDGTKEVYEQSAPNDLLRIVGKPL